MKLPSVQDIDPVISATWPAGKTWTVGQITCRDQGGGQRATAATSDGVPSDDEIEAAENAMTHRGEALFRIRPWESELDALLAGRGYIQRDRTNILVGPTPAIADRTLKPVSAFLMWPPLSIMEELWAAHGTGPDRIANMARVQGPKTGILGRGSDQPAGVGFAAIHNEMAMIHAVAVRASLRRQKIAENMMIAAARWAQENDARWITTLCVKNNEIANKLYLSLGMKIVGTYHYRAKSIPRGNQP